MVETPNPRDVAVLANEILRLEGELASLRMKWEALFNPPKEPRKLGGRPTRENSIASQVLSVINADAAKEWDAENLSQTLNADRDTVGSALYNLFVAKKIERVSRGVYVAANPYLNQIEEQLDRERKEAAQ